MNLPPQFQEPAGFQWGNFNNDTGARVRYGHIRPAGTPKGTVVLLPGFREPIEKYFEAIRGLTARGYAVWTMDWRGQGGSERYLDDPHKAHNLGFDEQLRTLHQFVDKVVDQKHKPLHVIAHSMGAHLALRYLHDNPATFDSAMFSAPMLDIATGGVPKPLARQMAKFAKAGNNLDKYVPGGGSWKDGVLDPEKSALSSDPERLKVMSEWYRAKGDLALGDPTYGWVYHALQSIDILNQEEYLKAIRTPILMQISGNEKVVVKGASERAARLLPACTRLDIPEARHEIWMERDELRDLWIAALDQFLQSRLEAHLQPKKPSAKRKAPRP